MISGHIKLFYSLTKWWSVAQPCTDICKRRAKVYSFYYVIIFYVIAVLGSDQQFLMALKNGLPKSVHLDDKLIKFDEVGVHAFAAQIPDILKQGGFKGIMLEILASFCSGCLSKSSADTTSVDW